MNKETILRSLMYTLARRQIVQLIYLKRVFSFITKICFHVAFYPRVLFCWTAKPRKSIHAPDTKFTHRSKFFNYHLPGYHGYLVTMEFVAGTKMDKNRTVNLKNLLTRRILVFEGNRQGNSVYTVRLGNPHVHAEGKYKILQVRYGGGELSGRGRFLGLCW